MGHFFFFSKLYLSLFSSHLCLFFPLQIVEVWLLYHYGHWCAHSIFSMFSVDFVVFVLFSIVVGIEEYTGDLRDKRTVRDALRHSIHRPLKQAKYITCENDDDLSVATLPSHSTLQIVQQDESCCLTNLSTALRFGFLHYLRYTVPNITHEPIRHSLPRVQQRATQVNTAT